MKTKARQIKELQLMSIFMAVYAVFTVIQNLFEMKTLGTPAFAVGGGGVMLSWATFMIMDITTELFGEKKTIQIYTLAGLLNLFIVLLSQLVIAIPGVYPEQNEAFRLIFSNGIRTALASFTAFWCGNFINMKVMVGMKKALKENQKGNGFLLFLRAVLSTIAGQTIDNLLFATLAFAPIGLSAFEMTWKDIATSSMMGVFNETVIEMLFVPFITIPVSKRIGKKLDKVDEENRALENVAV